MPQLDALLRPQRIAVVGASTTPGKLGHTVLLNLVRTGFPGEIHAVNPGGVAVEGRPGWRRIGDVPKPVDCAFLAIPASGVELAVLECAQAGVRSVVVGAAGFAELGTDEGRRRQDAIAAVAQAAGMRVLGPNTNGLMNLQADLSLGYNASHGEIFETGTVSIVSHSGALFDGIAKRLRALGCGINKFVAVGNEADVSMLDLLDELAEDAQTRVIGLVVEGLSDGARLHAIARRLHANGQRVVALKIGRSAEGASAALAHSSRLAGNARAWDALVQACGFAGVRTVEALAGGCALLASAGGPWKGPLVCATTSGAGGAILADFAQAWKLPLAPQWESELAQRIATLATSAPIRHPVDLGSLGDWALLTPVLRMLEEAGMDGPMVVYAHAPASPAMREHLVSALNARRQRCDAPLAVLAPGGLDATSESLLIAAGALVFRDTACCFESLACCAAPGFAPPDDAPRSHGFAPEHARLLARPSAVLSEADSAGLLHAMGVPMVASRAAASLEEALAAANAMGYPVVLKAISPGVAHKFREGLVSLDIGHEAQLRGEFERQHRRVGQLGAQAGTSWLVQPMRRSGLELLLGTSHEAGLGDFLVVGLGGVLAEVWDEVTLVAMPASRHAIETALRASRVQRLLDATDPSRAATARVVDVLQSLQALVTASAGRIESVEINPLLVTSGDCVAVDGLVVTRP